MKILNFGSCNLDYVYHLDHIVKPGETEAGDNMFIFPGGKGLNQSIAAARAGCEVFHAGCIGEDGEMLACLLKENRVDTRFLKSVNGKNGHAIIQISRDGENSIFLYPGSNYMIDKQDVDACIDFFAQGDIIILQNEINNIEYIIDKASERGMKIVLNPSPINDNILAIDLNKISYLVLNEGEASSITGKEDYMEALDILAEKHPNLAVMLTLGKHGCIYKCDGKEYRHPIFEVKAVDTTAAGDTFLGYFVWGIANNNAPSDIIKMASCASAIAVTRNGAAPSIPTLSEVKTALNSLKIKC